MKKLLLLALATLASTVMADEITFSFVNFSQSTFSASSSELQFANAINVLVTNNSNGKSVMLTAVDSGSTGSATDFTGGPPLTADYNGSGANSALITSNGHTFLSGEMADSGRLEAEWPNRAGAFLSRFHVSFIDPAILSELDAGNRVEPEGSVSLTLAETQFDGSSLTATLGGGEYTITTTSTVPENASLWLLASGIGLLGISRWWR